MTRTATIVGRRNYHNLKIYVVVIWGTIAAAVSTIFDLSAADALGIAFAALLVASLLYSFISLLRGYSASGQVLLDCRLHPRHRLFFQQALIFLVVGLAVGGTAQSGSIVRVGGFSFGILVAIYFVTLATGRLQVRTKGIWRYWGLLKWESIESYRWVSDGTLLVKTNGFWGLSEGAFPVPPENKSEFVEFVEKQCQFKSEGQGSAPSNLM